VEGRVAQGRASTGVPRSDPHWLDLLPSALIGAALVAAALAAYWLPGSVRYYNHFVWQALAFLDGRAAITWPVPGNDFFQDVFPLLDANGNLTGFGLLPFPPLPAIALMPVVAVFGLATDERAVSVVLGAIDVGLCWWALGRLPVSRLVRLAVTIFFGFGTVFWYAAQLGTTWFLAHVVAITPLMLAVGMALDGDRAARRGGAAPPERPWSTLLEDLRRGVRDPRALLDRRQFWAGLLFGLACTARLSIVFGAPFFILVGSGGSWTRRAISAGLGAAIPIGVLLLYNLATTGQFIHPGYEILYRAEAYGYPTLGYHPDWAIEDVRYLPQNLAIALAAAPDIAPSHLPGALGPAAPVCLGSTVRGLFDLDCPIATPHPIGMSILLTSPAYLLALPVVLRRGRSRLVVGAGLAILAIAVFNLMHFSQGWVQFGYRFSNDVAPFALLLVVLGAERLASRHARGMPLVAGLIVLSMAINLWGVLWSSLLGW